MDKKEIYEHLAKIYLDASKKKKRSSEIVAARDLLFVAFFIVSISVVAIIITTVKSRSLSNDAPLFVNRQITKIISHNSNPTRDEIVSFPLAELKLEGFSGLAFSARKMSPRDTLYLVIEFINFKKERSRVYLRSLDSDWKDFKLDFKEFSHISDWLSLARLSFSVEKRNRKAERGAVYISDIRFIRE